MPASTFRPVEVAFFRSLKPTWVILMKKPVNSKLMNQALKERTRFIGQTCQDFLLCFPERDPSKSDPGPLTFSEDVLARFPETVRQWFRNNTKDQGAHKAPQKQSARRQIHARNLATQQFKQQIKELARDILEVSPEMNQMTAFNKATTQFMENLKDEDPDGYEQLQKQAIELRGAAELDHTDMKPEVLQRLLKDFPQTFLDEIEQHGETLPVHIWCIVAMAIPPAQDIKLYTVATRSIEAIHTSEANRSMKDSFTNWLKNNLGLQAPGSVSNATEAVYPDINGSFRPMFPAKIGEGTISAHKLRGWLRTYFNYLHMWQGAPGSVAWKLVLKDHSGQYVQLSRMPPGITTLRSPSDMQRDELDSWRDWIVSGQQGKLTDDQVFQFASVPRGKGKPPLVYTTLLKVSPECSQLQWSADEKLYAYKLRAAKEDANNKPSWLGLPLARMHCVYAPFSETARGMISAGLAAEYQGHLLVDLILEMERYGPVHTSDAQCTEELPAYISLDMNDDELRDLIFGQPLRPAALLEDDPDYPDYALSTFLRWARSSTRLRHIPSDTWRGGPKGVRWVFGIYLHFAITFTLYTEYPDKLPTDRIKALDQCHFQRLQASLITFADWFSQSLKTSIERLKTTFKERAHAWKKAVVESHFNDPDDNIGHHSVSCDTHGIPRARATLRDCYHHLQEQDPDITIGQDNHEFEVAQRRTRRRVAAALDQDDESELSDRDSLSGEMIDLPDGDTDDEIGDSTDSDIGFKTQEGGFGDSEAEDNEIFQSLLASSISRTYCAGQEEHASEIGLPDNDLIKHNQITEHSAHESLNDTAGPSATNSDVEDNVVMPKQILLGLLPLKLQKRPPPRSSSRKWQMEVVIPTPRKQAPSAMTSRKNPQEPAMEPFPGDVSYFLLEPSPDTYLPMCSAEPESSETEDIPSLPLAKRRPRRSIQRSQQVEDAIKAGRKGTYRSN